MKKSILIVFVVLVLVGLYFVSRSNIPLKDQPASTISSNVDNSFGKIVNTSQRGAPPKLITLPATNIGSTGVILNGAIIPNGTPVNVWFYVFDTQPQNNIVLQTPAVSITTGVPNQIATPVSYQATGLLPNTKYIYEICESTAQIGLMCAGVREFTTQPIINPNNVR